MTAVGSLDKFTWPSPEARFSGFSVAVGTANEPPVLEVGGSCYPDQTAPEIRSTTRFDLASITKLYTAAVAAILSSQGKLDLAAPIGSWFKVSKSLSSLTTNELLTHTAGLPDVWEEQESRQETIAALLDIEPDQRQRGSILYSCTGYSLFSVGVEQLFGKRFDEVVQELILDPLELTETGYTPLASTKNIATSCEPHEQIPAGVVHDPRARHMDGVSGNAGLFGTAADLHRFFSEVVTGSDGVVTDDARKVLFSPIAFGQWDQAIGFRHNDLERLGANQHFFSHTGFTGTLAMLDPATKKIAVLLANRLVVGTSREQMAEVYQSFANSEVVSR